MINSQIEKNRAMARAVLIEDWEVSEVATYWKVTEDTVIRSVQAARINDWNLCDDLPATS